MSIRIFNTLTKQKETFVPFKKGKVGIYACGVTVYDVCHIGHARSLYIFEVVRRYLEYRGLIVKFVRNITDIDDKIINRAKELNISWKEVTNEFIESYQKDLKRLRIQEADVEPRATENIKEMIKHIKGLINKGFAYERAGDVYFNVRKFSEYGKLSGQSIDQMLQGVRIEPSEHKTDPLDFALWKASKPDEPYWVSPWGKGRPGWHIECSVMSAKYLGETFDIHAGGRDLVFPHHENEIAQSEALTGKPFARYWMHHGLLTINGQKMAKSLGNFVTVKDFMDKYKDEDILKLFFLSAHYSQPIDYNEAKIEEVKKQKKSFDSFLERAYLPLEARPSPKFLNEDKAKIDVICEKLQEAMDNDFNMPQALGHMFELIDFASVLEAKAYDYARAKLEVFFEIFGLKVKPKIKLTQEIIKMAYNREKAKQEKDFKKADDIRQDLKNKYGFNPSDTKTGLTFTKL